MKKFTELLKVLLIVGALTTFAFSAVAREVVEFTIECDVTPDICATVTTTDDHGDSTIFAILGTFVSGEFVLE